MQVNALSKSSKQPLDQKPIQRKKTAFKKRVFRNGDAYLSALVTAGGLVSTLATGNPTGFYPLYTRLYTWDFPYLHSAYKKSSQGIEDSRREFTDSKFFAHLSNVGTAWLGPPVSQILRNNISDDLMVKNASAAVGMTQGLINVILMKGIRSNLTSDNNAPKDLNFYINQSLKAHIDEIYKNALQSKNSLKDKNTQEKIYRQIFDPTKLEIALQKARRNFAQDTSESVKSDMLKISKPLGLPQINLQNLITMAIAGGFLYFNRQNTDTDGRAVGNPMMQIGCASRLMNAMYQMFYEPIFEKRDRSFTKDFWSLKTGHTKADILTAAIFGLSKPIASYLTNNDPKQQQLTLKGHGFAMGAAALTGLVVNQATPLLKYFLDSDDIKAKEAGIMVKNLMNDQIDRIENLDKISNKHIMDIIIKGKSSK